ncbi:MAG TPA: hypothetical protein VIJ51_00210 [Solirubrobacteraceae bacterium]
MRSTRHGRRARLVDLDRPPANTTYDYRLVATNADGTTIGAVESFTTGPGA